MVFFHPSFSSQKAKGVDEHVASSHKTAACTRDISNYALTLLHRQLHNVCHTANLNKSISMYFAIIQLLCHVNVLVSPCNVFRCLEARTDCTIMQTIYLRKYAIKSKLKFKI